MTKDNSPSTGSKSKKPRMPGINRIKNTPKAFRSSDKTGLNHLICCNKNTAFKLGDKIMRSGRYLKAQERREKIEAMMAKGVSDNAKKEPSEKESE